MNHFKDMQLFYTITCAMNNVKTNLFECILAKYFLMVSYKIKVRILF